MTKISKNTPIYTIPEEILNSVSHGIGLLLAVVGSVIAIIMSVSKNDIIGVVSVIIYGISLIVLYTMSTLYHALIPIKVKGVFRILDHAAIFILIAGSYTPFALITLRGNNVALYILIIVWSIAVIGIVLNSINLEKYKTISTILYVVSGWITVFVAIPITQNLALNGVILLFLGGAFYTVGIIFYKMKSKRYFHGIWHFFVLIGSILHYYCILEYVINKK